MNPKVKSSLESVLRTFETGDIADVVAYASIPNRDIPMSKWSLTNQVLAFIHGTADARGIRQWNEAKRHVKKGSKAFHILAPRFAKTETENGEEDTILVGFLAVPVFRAEDTDGEPLENPYRNIPMPRLSEVAEKFGVSVKFSGSNQVYWGCYSPTQKAITLCTPDENVFFHELAHAAHYRVKNDLKPGQDWKKEVVAELSACVISRLYGKRMDGNAYKYISNYAQKAKKNPLSACMSVLSDVQAVLSEIFSHVESETVDVAA